jgi:hypothetical protein
MTILRPNRALALWLLWSLVSPELCSSRQTGEVEVGNERGGQTPIFSSQGHESENNSAIADEFLVRASKDARRILVVSRLGRRERGMRLHQRRLHNAVERLLIRKRFAREKVIPLIGERVTGRARIEYYIGEQLYWVIELDTNRDFIVECCGRLPEYYPDFRGTPSVRF